MMREWTGLAMVLMLAGLVFTGSARANDQWVVYEGREGPGKGRHIVLIAGDDEYRSEELIPQMGRILAVHHGFKCTVLFPIHRQSGEIDTRVLDNIPGLEHLKTADLMVMFLRFRDLPDDQMKMILDYANSGKPMISLRTNTHAFNFRNNKTYAQWTWNARGDKPGGFGRQVFGETWVNHYGIHNRESTRGLVAKGQENHPIVRGADDIWGPSDVYGLTTLHGDCVPLVMGQVLVGMNPTDPPNEKKQLTPVAWTKTYTGEEGRTARVFTTTMGHADDFRSEGFRRLMINACYWALGMEEQIPARSRVDLVGRYEPLPIGMGTHRRGVKPADLKLPE
jgi:hypothetical protein